MKKGNVYLFGSIILAVIIYATTILILDKKNIIDAGTFGDMFGALNTLFTGLAFVGVVISLLQQNKALEQQNISLEKQQLALDQQQLSLNKQQEELEMYKDELKNNTVQLMEQSKNFHLQRIETTFFNLMEAHLNILSKISSGGMEGQQLFDHIFAISPKQNNLSDSEYFDSLYSSLPYASLHAYRNFIFILRYIEYMVIEEERDTFVGMINAYISFGTLYYYSIYAKHEKNQGLSGKLDYDLMKKYHFMR